MKTSSSGSAKTTLVIVLIVIAVAVFFMSDFHMSRESPYQNELFFGPAAKPVPEESATATGKAKT